MKKYQVEELEGGKYQIKLLASPLCTGPTVSKMPFAVWRDVVKQAVYSQTNFKTGDETFVFVSKENCEKAASILNGALYQKV